MKNKEVADILDEIADYLEMQDVKWKPQAYRKAARNVENLSESVEELYEEEQLQDLDGVGENIAEKIIEYLETGKLEYLQELKQDIPVDIEALTAVEGLGPRKVKEIYEARKVTDLDELEEAAESGEIADIEGFGEKTEENILKHIEIARRGQDRMLLGKAYPIAEELRSGLEKSDNFDRVKFVGSFRRKRPTVGDIDILATSNNPGEAMEEFAGREDVIEVLGSGQTKSSILISGDLQVDLRIVSETSFGAALQYFTGSKDHNVGLRTLAVEKGLKLNEYGLFDSEENKLAGETENSVYSNLQLDFIEPELRERTGEIEAAAKGKIPDLVEKEDIKGDLQMHTDYSDGKASMREMAEKAESSGLEYILITDHVKALDIADGIDEKALIKQAERIDELNEELEIEILKGIEANITGEGLDISRDKLKELDIVLASLHGRINSPTEKIIKVFRDYPVDIFAHPLNRKINSRKGLDIDLDKIIKVAAEEKVALEINSQPERLDLPWREIKEYREDVKFVVSTDAHSAFELSYMHLGVAQARRGWCSKEEVLNTRPLEGLRSYFE